ncbi:MAG: hypothetical protein IKL86_02625 [Clostridia bacterium]|nr:hypothetical protein [Clostridia bacterium]
MEILKFVRKGGKRALALAFALMFILLTLVGALLSLDYSGDKVAYADNSNIGASGGAIEIADETPNKVSATFSSKEQGVKLKITLPLSATGIYFAYEVDSSEPVWAIYGDANINDDIPYIKHAGACESFVAPSATIADKVESKWSDISIVYEKKVFYIELHYNGTLYVECDMPGETSRLSATSIVKDIDNLAPKMSTDRITHGVLGTDGKYAFGLTLKFMDTQSTGTLSTARCGLEEIMILRTDMALTDLTEENLTDESVEVVKKWGLLSPLSAILEQTIKFNVEKDGYYYYFVVDRVGNLNIGTLFDNKFERENYDDTDDRFMICMDVTTYPQSGVYSVKSNMVAIGQELDKNKENTNSTVYNRAMESYSALLLRFYTGDALTDKIGVTNDWFSFFYGDYTAFKNAYSIGATYSVDITNGDLLGGTLSAVNLNKNTLPSLGGGDVKAEFIVAKYAKSDLPDALKDALNGNGYAYKLNYKLTVNGQQVSIPKTDLVYEVINLQGDIKNADIYIKIGDTYTLATAQKGANWVRFGTSLNSAEYYLVITESEQNSDLTWLWITLGVVGGVALIGGAVVGVVLWKKKAKSIR